MGIKLNKRQMVFLLGALAVVVIAGAILFLVFKGPRHTQSDVLPEQLLPTSISSGYSANDLQNDVNLANKALVQETRDMVIANKGIKNWTVTNTKGFKLSGNSALKRVIDEQLSASAFLGKGNEQQLKSLLVTNVNSTVKLNSLLRRVSMIKAADDQSVAEKIMGQLGSRLASAIGGVKKQGVAVSDLNADLTTFDSDQVAASNISSTVESSLVKAAPTNTEINGYEQSLTTAQTDCLAALTAANAIIGILRY